MLLLLWILKLSVITSVFLYAGFFLVKISLVKKELFSSSWELGYLIYQ